MKTRQIYGYFSWKKLWPRRCSSRLLPQPNHSRNTKHPLYNHLGARRCRMNEKSFLGTTAHGFVQPQINQTQRALIGHHLNLFRNHKPWGAHAPHKPTPPIVALPSRVEFPQCRHGKFAYGSASRFPDFPRVKKRTHFLATSAPRNT